MWANGRCAARVQRCGSALRMDFSRAAFACSPRSAFSDDLERCPDRRMGIQRVRGVVHVCEHGAAQRLGAAERGVGLENVEC